MPMWALIGLTAVVAAVRAPATFGAKEGSAHRIVDFERSRSCHVQMRPMPPRATGMPWLQDAWVSPDGTRARFISQNQCPCLDGAGDDGTPKPLFCRNAMPARYRCVFYDERERVVGPERGVCSTPARSSHGRGAVGTIYFECPLPAAARPLALNTGARAQLFADVRVGYRQQCDAEGDGDGDAAPSGTPAGGGGGEGGRGGAKVIGTRVFRGGWQAVPLCACPVVNNGTLARLPGAPPPVPQAQAQAQAQALQVQALQRKFLSGCLFTTADPYFNEQNHWVIGENGQRLAEWLEYHLLPGVGFQHFFVFDNSRVGGAQGALLPLLMPYVDRGVVTYVHWPHTNCAGAPLGNWLQQYGASNSCVRRFAPASTFIADFDEDEFVVPYDALSVLMTYYGLCSRGGRRRRSTRQLYLQRYACAGGPMEARNKLIMRADAVLLHSVHSATVRADGGQPRVLVMQGTQAAPQAVGIGIHDGAGPTRPDGPPPPLMLLHAKSGFFHSVLNNDQPLAKPNEFVRGYWVPRLRRALQRHNPTHAQRASAVRRAWHARWVKMEGAAMREGGDESAHGGAGGAKQAPAASKLAGRYVVVAVAGWNGTGAATRFIATRPGSLLGTVDSPARAAVFRVDLNPRRRPYGHCYWLDVVSPKVEPNNLHADTEGDHRVSVRYPRLDDSSCFRLEPAPAAHDTRDLCSGHAVRVTAAATLEGDGNEQAQYWTVDQSDNQSNSHELFTVEKGGTIRGRSTVGHRTLAKKPQTRFLLLPLLGAQDAAAGEVEGDDDNGAGSTATSVPTEAALRAGVTEVLRGCKIID
eukprot:g5514.t1